MTEDTQPNLHVEFLGCSNDPIEVLFSAYQVCHSTVPATVTWHKIRSGEISRSTMEAVVEERIGTNQTAPLRQVQFIFVVDNLSSACSALFNRYQITLDSDETFHHYIETKQDPRVFVTPPSFNKNNAVIKQWRSLQKDILSFYRLCEDQGIQPDEAKFALPMGTVLRVQFSMGFQTLQQFLDHQLCEKASWEGREIAWQILRVMKKEFPNLSSRLGIKCWENRNLFCDEDFQSYHGCKWSQTRPHKNDLTEMWRLNRKIS